MCFSRGDVSARLNAPRRVLPTMVSIVLQGQDCSSSTYLCWLEGSLGSFDVFRSISEQRQNIERVHRGRLALLAK